MRERLHTTTVLFGIQLVINGKLLATPYRPREIQTFAGIPAVERIGCVGQGCLN